MEKKKKSLCVVLLIKHSLLKALCFSHKSSGEMFSAYILIIWIQSCICN